jgi:hypothetical protein
VSTVPVLLVLAAAAGLGLYNLREWWGGRRRMGLIAAYLLLGVGGAEALVGVLHGSDLAADDPLRHMVKIALLMLGAAIFTGFGAPLLRKTSLSNIALAAHVGAGLAGFYLVLTLGARL